MKRRVSKILMVGIEILLLAALVVLFIVVRGSGGLFFRAHPGETLVTISSVSMTIFIAFFFYLIVKSFQCEDPGAINILFLRIAHGVKKGADRNRTDA